MGPNMEWLILFSGIGICFYEAFSPTKHQAQNSALYAGIVSSSLVTLGSIRAVTCVKADDYIINANGSVFPAADFSPDCDYFATI